MPPSLLVTATVDRVARISPAFVRVWFTGPIEGEGGRTGS